MEVELPVRMYKLNKWFSCYGCLRYKLKTGDEVEWVYTCDEIKAADYHYSVRNGNYYE